MKNLLQSQGKLANEIFRASENFRKDSATRKTLDYAETRLNILKENWRKYFEQHEKLTNHQEALRDQPYFVEKTFETTQSYYNKLQEALSLIESFQKNDNGNDDERGSVKINDGSNDVQSHASRQSDEILGNNEISNVEKLFQLQYYDMLDLIEEAEQTDETISAGMIEVQLELLKTSFTTLQKSYFDVRISGAKIDRRGFNMAKIQKEFTTVTGMLLDVVNASKRSFNVDQQSGSVQSNKLPAVKIPDFDGTPNMWKRFISLFDELVHNNKSIDKSIKMQYSKTYVKGEAARLINHVAPIGENYETYVTHCSKNDTKINEKF